MYMGQIFAVTSGKGGVGKSTVSVGLGMAFAAAGYKTLLVDMDEGLRCLDMLLGVDKNVVFDLSDILIGGEIEKSVYECETVKGLSLIPAPANAGKIDAFSFSCFVKTAAEMYDTVIFDFPAGMDFSLYTCLTESALFLTVSVPDPVSVRDAAAVSKKLSELSLNSRLIINRFSYRLCKKSLFRGIDDMIDTSGLQLIGVVPESYDLTALPALHRIPKGTRSAAAFGRIVKRLCGKQVLLPKPKKI